MAKSRCGSFHCSLQLPLFLCCLQASVVSKQLSRTLSCVLCFQPKQEKTKNKKTKKKRVLDNRIHTKEECRSKHTGKKSGETRVEKRKRMKEEEEDKEGMPASYLDDD